MSGSISKIITLDPAALTYVGYNVKEPHHTARLVYRVARFFRGTTYQNGENILNNHKIYQTAIKYTK
jgi:hypothetical protein